MNEEKNKKKDKDKDKNMNDKNSSSTGAAGIVGNAVTDVLKKIVSSGFDAAVKKEGSVKDVISDLVTSKELIKDISQGILKHTKDEIVNSVSKKVKEQLQKIDVQKELQKIIDNYDIEIVSKITLKKKDAKAAKADKADKTDVEEQEDTEFEPDTEHRS
ncbi:MAG: hypothetical protein HQK49_14980 [Oligoflexia bacterium]|nr:hypothetical protein [Oligoflexia bacterium]